MGNTLGGLRGGRALRVLAVATASALSLTLAACGDGDDESEDGKLTLTVWSSREHYVPMDSFKGFMDEHPDINVKVEVHDNDDILQTLLRMKDAGQDPPDIIQDDVGLIATYAQADLIAPLDEQLATWQQEDKASYDEILEPAWRDSTVDGQVFGMSMNAPMDALNYNVSWFEDAGLPVPWEPQTLDEVYDALLKLKDARPDSVPLAVQAKPDEGVTMLKTLLAAAGTEFDGAKPDLTSDASKYILDWFIRAQKDGLLPENAVSWGEAETRGGFLQGKIGILSDSQGAAYDFNESADFKYPDDWATAVIPRETGKGTSGVTITAAKTWAMTSGTKHPYEASLLLRYIGSSKVQTAAMAELGGSPTRNGVALTSTEVQETYPFFTEALREAFETSAPAPAGPGSGAVEGVLTDMFGEIVSGTDLSAAEIAEKYQPEIDEAK